MSLAYPPDSSHHDCQPPTYGWDQCRRQGGGSNRGSLPQAPSLRGPPKQCWTRSNMHPFSDSRSKSMTYGALASSGLRSSHVRYNVHWSLGASSITPKQTNKKSRLTWNQQYSETNPLSFKSACLARAPYDVLLPPNKDGNLQVCMHACTKRSLRSPQNTLQSI